MSVVGFDLGYQACYVAIARHGGVEVVANEYSDRRSPTLVGLSRNQRLMGVSAKNQQVMNFKNTLWGFKVLLGRKFSDPFVQEEIKQLPFTVIQLQNDNIGIKVMYGENEQVFTPEQVTAMMLTYLKGVAEKALGKPVADCVISVPSYFCDSQRRALLDASVIAGLNCLRLFNETTAAALAYGIYKQDLPAENEKARKVVFVDIGHSSLQVVICAFQKGKLKVLSKSFDPSLGGRNFDRRIMEHFAEEFKQRYKVDVLSNPRKKLQLTNECEKLKKLMSTVVVPQTLAIDCFADDKDVVGKMKRDDFNQMITDLVHRVRTTLEDALAKSHLSLGEIDSVELVGGSCRVPIIKEVIADTFKRELRTTLNLDEAVARGCALQCAMLSPAFKVRDFSITDTQPYPIKLKWQAAMEGEEGDMVVFKEGDAIYHSKVLTFYRKDPFELQAVYSNPYTIPCPNSLIGVFRVNNVVPTAEDEASKVKVKVRINIHGIFFVKSASMVEKVKPEEEPPVVNEVEQMETNQSEPSKPETIGEAQTDMEETTGSEATPNANVEPLQEEQDVGGSEEAVDTPGSAEEGNGAGEQTTPTANGQESNDNSPKVEKKADESAKQPEVKKAKKPTVRSVDLPVTSCISSLTKKELDLANEREVNMKYQDQLESEKADARNAVEEYVYNMRDKIGYSLSDFISNEDKDTFMALLNSTEEWLYEEGEDQPKKVYVERLAELQKFGNPVVMRETEYLERPKAFEDLGSKIVHFEKILTLYAEGNELYDHLEGAEIDKVKEQVATKREWLNAQMLACQSLAKSHDPPVTSAQIRAEVKNLDSACNPIVSKPKPKVEPPKDNQPTETEEKGEPTESTKMEAEQTTESQNSTEPPHTEDMDLD